MRSEDEIREQLKSELALRYEKTFKLLGDAINYRKELEEKYHKKEEIICPM